MSRADTQITHSQVEVTDVVRAFTKNIPGDGLEFLNNAAEKVKDTVALIPYNDSTRAAEAKLRWRRTATQIITDGYVYEGKSCTDDVIVFLAVCRAKRL